MSEARTRAWRRFKDKVNNGRGMGCDKPFKPEKKWRHLYLRECKLARARQLGISYPRKSQRQLLDQEMPVDE